MFAGSLVALITPMTSTGEVDQVSLRQLVHWHIEQGTHSLVPVGTTGESPVLTVEEHRKVLQIVVEEAAGNIPVIAGAGSNNTAAALEFHTFARTLGADASLHVTGYYNRPSQEGIYRHFQALSQHNELPIIVYNIPPRAVVDITVETMARLAELPTVVGVKDATRDLSRPALEQQQIAQPFTYLSGEDATAVAYNAAGGNGCISVVANVFPKICACMQQACLRGDFHRAMRIQRALMPLHIALSREPSPAGVKYACSRLGLCQPTVRLPIIELRSSSKNEIDLAMSSIDVAEVIGNHPETARSGV